jgi:DNA primase
VRQYRMGWAPDGWDQLVRALGSPGALVDAGLATVDESGRYTDFFRGRLLFPIFEAGGKAVGFGGRSLPGGRNPKYKNTAGTAVYDKSQVLYGLNWAKRSVVEVQRVVVCEGYTDVIGLQGAGVEEAVATCGTALADGHIRLLTRFARRIVLAYDADAAGQTAAERFYEWEKRFDVDIRVAALPPGTDPADLARQDPAALARAVEEARPYLGFRLERLFARADLATVEGRARAAAEATAMVAQHPNELVRDQYLVQVADRCRIQADQARRLATASVAGATEAARPAPSQGRPEPVAVTGPELEALRLAVHHPEDVASRLEPVLFAHPLGRAAFDALLGATTLHAAIEAADPQAADLLQRLAIEEPTTEADDVMTRLVERAGHRALRQLEAEMRQAAPSDQPGFAPTVAWLKLALETVRTDEAVGRVAAMEAEQRLVVWLVARDEAQSLREATDE